MKIYKTTIPSPDCRRDGRLIRLQIFFYLLSLRINGERNGISSKSATTPT